MRDATEQTDVFGSQALEGVVLELEWWDTTKPRGRKEDQQTWEHWQLPQTC